MDKNFKIEKNIPIPGRKCVFPLEDMQVGDSIFIPTEKNKTLPLLQQNVMSLIRRWMLKNNSHYKFTSRRQDGGLRVWRVK